MNERGEALEIKQAITVEYRAQAEALQRGDLHEAWLHLERAHILAQTRFLPHLVSHGKMFALAVRMRDGREAAGQILRLVLAPLGNLTGRLPIGNTGRSTVSAFAPMDIPPDLQAVLDRDAG